MILSQTLVFIMEINPTTLKVDMLEIMEVDNILIQVEHNIIMDHQVYKIQEWEILFLKTTIPI